MAQLQRMMDTKDDIALLKRAGTMLTALQAAEQARPPSLDPETCPLLPSITQLPKFVH